MGGTPQIEVTFDVDANGIMNISAVEKGTGKSQSITITNNKGRLDQSEIDRLVKEAEKHKAEDENIKAKVEAKNGLEHYCYTIKQQLDDAKMKDTSLRTKRNLSLILLTAPSNGWKEIQMLNLMSTKLNKKLVRMFGTQSCKEFTKMGGQPGGMPGG